MSTLASIDPLTGEVVGTVPLATPEQIRATVARARDVQPAWGGLPVRERLRRLQPAGQRLAERGEELAELITREMGKPLREARAEVARCAALEDELESIASALDPEVRDDGQTRSVIYRDPFGVAAVITPWNFPCSMIHWLVVPALMAGNAVVLKPSEETPLVGRAYADALREVLPSDVLQVVHGADEQGRALVAADVDLIAFTGSRATGKQILAAASGDLKRVILELGGKDPLLVLEDADLAAAASFAAEQSFRNAGQVCVSTERIYVHESVADEFLAAFAERAGGLRVGSGFDERTDVGPMVNERQRAHVLRQIDEAVTSGARVVQGGGEHPERFVRPTVLADVCPEMDIAREETFGPVVFVTRVADDDEAVRLANDSPFGLGAVVFGEPEHSSRVARRLSAGMVGVNRRPGGAAGTPWVGARESGYGYHKSPEGHRQFAQTRVVSTPAEASLSRGR